MAKRIKKPWPTKAVMHQIYDLKLWGGNEFDFYSGQGSHDSKVITPYLNDVITFLKSHNTSLVVCDLGCGDFNIGKHFTKYTKKYIAVDIVEKLIERNKALFKEENLEFQCLNIAKDELPEADCIIIRQVLQHLSNDEILNIVKKLNNYKYIILTEHLPTGDFITNKDIISGQGIRLKQNSGVDLSETPFNLKFKEEKTGIETVLDNNKGSIKTILYTL
ncbi:class I SAM-dependent methyltransferase [uncultured Winogradskyella sp.]|uniref:class I SAM-dependent methyltransferase n=1 Tax=uncultured Winogradskyella sp. TaxID=395353 RepID=UPI0030DB78A6